MAWPTNKPDSDSFNSDSDSIRDSRVELKKMSDAVNDIVDFIDTSGIQNNHILVYDSGSGTLKVGQQMTHISAGDNITVDQDSAGGVIISSTATGLANPLTADMDLAGFAISSGVGQQSKWHTDSGGHPIGIGTYDPIKVHVDTGEAGQIRFDCGDQEKDVYLMNPNGGIYLASETYGAGDSGLEGTVKYRAVSIDETLGLIWMGASVPTLRLQTQDHSYLFQQTNKLLYLGCGDGEGADVVINQKYLLPREQGSAGLVLTNEGYYEGVLNGFKTSWRDPFEGIQAGPGIVIDYRTSSTPVDSGGHYIPKELIITSDIKAGDGITISTPDSAGSITISASGSSGTDLGLTGGDNIVVTQDSSAGYTISQGSWTNPIDANEQVLTDPGLKGYTETIHDMGTSSGTKTPDKSDGNVQKITLNGNLTLNAFASPAAGDSITLIITQDGTGNRTLSSTMKFASASKTLSTAGNSIDVVSMFYDGSRYLASLSKGFA